MLRAGRRAWQPRLAAWRPAARGFTPSWLRLAGGRRLRRSLRLLFGRLRVGLGFRLGVSLGISLGISLGFSRFLGRLVRRGFLLPGNVALRILVVLEVGLVPPAAFQAEDRRGDEALQRWAAAGRALAQAAPGIAASAGSSAWSALARLGGLVESTTIAWLWSRRHESPFAVPQGPANRPGVAALYHWNTSLLAPGRFRRVAPMLGNQSHPRRFFA